MALSTGMAGAGGGAAMAMNPGMALGGNAMAAPQVFSSFEPPPSAGPPPGADAAAPGRVGGAYDLRSWEKQGEPDEDLHACLGVDVGSSSIKVKGKRPPEYVLWVIIVIPAIVGFTRAQCMNMNILLLLLVQHVLLFCRVQMLG